jgi:molecular chaperone HtpG
LLKDEDFFEAMKDLVIFKSASGDYLTVEEYKTRNQSAEGKTRIWYAASEDAQVSYLNLMKEQGIEVIFQNSPLDTHLYQRLEAKLENVEFVRIDSEVNDLLVDSALPAESQSDKLAEIFYRALGQEVEASFSKDSYAEYLKKHPQAVNLLAPYIIQQGERSIIKPYDIPLKLRDELGEEAVKDLFEHVYTELKVEVKSLKSSEIPSMIVFSEYMRRWHDMDMLSRNAGGDLLKHHTLVVNQENPTIKKILELDEQGKTEEVNTLCSYIHDLSLLEQKPFNGQELKEFIAKANKILNYL